MKTLESFVLKNRIQNAVIYLLTALLLFLIEYIATGDEHIKRYALRIFVIAILFMHFYYLGTRVHLSLVHRSSDYLLTFYIVVKFLRMLLALALFCLFAILGSINLWALALNIMVFYVVALITSIRYYVKMEQKLK